MYLHLISVYPKIVQKLIYGSVHTCLLRCYFQTYFCRCLPKRKRDVKLATGSNCQHDELSKVLSLKKTDKSYIHVRRANLKCYFELYANSNVYLSSFTAHKLNSFFKFNWMNTRKGQTKQLSCQQYHILYSLYVVSLYLIFLLNHIQFFV